MVVVGWNGISLVEWSRQIHISSQLPTCPQPARGVMGVKKVYEKGERRREINPFSFTDSLPICKSKIERDITT